MHGIDIHGDRPRARVIAFPIVIFTAVGTVGTALTPVIAPHHPLVMILLEARDRNLLLARHISLAAFVGVGVVRRLASDPFFYLLGRHYGDNAVRWLEAHGGGSAVRATERAFRRAAYPMLVIFPGAVVCALAGDAEIPPTVFGVILVVRTLAAVLVIRWLGDMFAGPIDRLLHLLDHYLVPATTLTVVLVVAWVFWERRPRSAAGDEPAAGDQLAAGDEPAAEDEPIEGDEGPDGWEPTA